MQMCCAGTDESKLKGDRLVCNRTAKENIFMFSLTPTHHCVCVKYLHNKSTSEIQRIILFRSV